LGLAGSAATPFAGRPKDWSDEYGLPNWYRNYLAVAGSCLMARRDLFESLGGFDEGFRRDRADADLCLRAREAGWEVFYNPYAAFTDHAADEVPAFADQADEDRFGRRWSRYVLGGDPYLNLNFARESSRMVLRMDGLAPNRLPTARRAA
jgi:GT2 family glycosyltransferase